MLVWHTFQMTQEKQKKPDNCLTTDLHFDKWCSKFQEVIDIAQFFFQYKENISISISICICMFENCVNQLVQNFDLNIMKATKI